MAHLLPLGGILIRPIPGAIQIYLQDTPNAAGGQCGLRYRILFSHHFDIEREFVAARSGCEKPARAISCRRQQKFSG
jgi:hypothetical protein